MDPIPHLGEDGHGRVVVHGVGRQLRHHVLVREPGAHYVRAWQREQMTGRRIVRTRSETEKAARSAVRSTPEPASCVRGHDRRLTGEDVFDGARVDADGRHHFRVLRQGGFSTHMKTSVSNQNSTFHKVLLSHETKWSVAKQICPNHQPGAEYAAQDSRDHREYYRILGSPQP